MKVQHSVVQIGSTTNELLCNGAKPADRKELWVVENDGENALE